MSKAIITIKSNISSETDEVIEVVSPGIFSKKDDGYKIVYYETELSGMKGTKTSLIINEDDVLLEREGTTKSKMYFKKNKLDLSLYDTPYGMMEIEIKTQDLKVNMDENGGQVSIKYKMFIGGENVQKTNMEIEVRKK